jgi:predicted glycoside hydrolase/deacetylase ChbG (UPF0249 family)
MVLNADDFGMSRRVNGAIHELLVAGRISSATLMVNAPHAADAVALLKGRPDLLRRIGLHLNLRQFRPLNPRLLGSPFVNPDDQLQDFRVHRVALLDKLRRFRDVVDEIDLQVRRFRELTGGDPAHLDSHGHLHTTPYLFLALLFAKEVGRRTWIRPSRLYPCDEKTLRLRGRILLKHLFNRVLAWRFRSVECLVSLIHLDESILCDACLEQLAGRYSLIEVMCHPDPEGEHRPEYLALQRDRFAGSELISYAELASAG